MRISDWSSDVCSSDLAAPCPANAWSKAERNRSNSRSRPTKPPRARRSSGFPEESECEAERASGSTASSAARDRKSVVEGKSGTVRVELGGCRDIKKKQI